MGAEVKLSGVLDAGFPALCYTVELSHLHRRPASVCHHTACQAAVLQVPSPPFHIPSYHERKTVQELRLVCCVSRTLIFWKIFPDCAVLAQGTILSSESDGHCQRRNIC